MKLVRGVTGLALVALLAVVGCKSSLPPSTLANMGGVEGLTKFTAAWTDTMSTNPELTKSLTPDDMNMLAKGFGNEVAKAAEIPTPNAGVDLEQLLNSKHLTKQQLLDMANALGAA